MSEYLDEDGYPTEEALDLVKGWGHEDGFVELLETVGQIWKYPDYFECKGPGQYEISTGGWSGNEDLIEALQGNAMFWLCCWVQSTRGGHYIFEVPEELRKLPKKPTET